MEQAEAHHLHSTSLCSCCSSHRLIGRGWLWSFCCLSAPVKVDNSAALDASAGQECTGKESMCEIVAPAEQVMKDVVAQCGLRRFGYGDLKVATRSFQPDSLLGEGGFGCVFKGWVDESGTVPVKPGTGLTVAVKILNPNSLQGHNEWLAEVYFLGLLHHPNLVKLVGFCMEEDHRLLVYEFMRRGSLENHLFRRGAVPLAWDTRMKVALGAAEGLNFLHGRSKAVIYRDFKTSNILLDVDFNAKLSDFGLAKDGPDGDKSHVSTRVMGTYGYAAPEYVMTGHLTARSDVYSFGVVLLEIVTGKKCMDKSRPSGEHNLVQWARSYLNEKKRVFRLIDSRLSQYSERGAFKAASLAFRCISLDPRVRPLMPEVVQTLASLQNMKDITENPFYQQQLYSYGSSKSFH